MFIVVFIFVYFFDTAAAAILNGMNPFLICARNGKAQRKSAGIVFVLQWPCKYLAKVLRRKKDRARSVNHRLAGLLDVF